MAFESAVCSKNDIYTSSYIRNLAALLYHYQSQVCCPCVICSQKILDNPTIFYAADTSSYIERLDKYRIAFSWVSFMISFTVNQEIRIIFTHFSLTLHANPRRARIRSEYPQGDSNNGRCRHRARFFWLEWLNILS